MMRGGLSTVLQTLTPEAAAVVNHSVAEAGRRKHGQTTPLHLAATLLSSPSGYFRQACTGSHPNSSHPLQCRALDLCFSVALERLPMTQNVDSPGTDPPLSNALMAALKRAQAHQRRGCPEQQQQPLLAVKVELEQLLLSILDDPSVSRVMREARFSSSAVKSTIEKSMNSNPGTKFGCGSVGFAGIGPRILSNPCQLSPTSKIIEPPLINRNIYLNPRLQRRTATGTVKNQSSEHVKTVLEIMGRGKGRNPVLVGDLETEALKNELLREIENKELQHDGIFMNLQILSLHQKELPLDKNQVTAKIEALEALVASKLRFGGVLVDLGDLKWLMEHPHKEKQIISELGQAMVAEISKLLVKFYADGSGNKLWLIATAACDTYLRCQVHHSTMETDWDLQAVPIASRSPLHGTSPRLLELPTKLSSHTRHVLEDTVSTKSSNLCPHCTDNYEKEVTKLKAIGNSVSEARNESSKSLLPQWMQSAKEPGIDQEMQSKKSYHDLQKKWRDICIKLHADFHKNSIPAKASALLSPIALHIPGSLACPPFQMSKPPKETLQLNVNPLMCQQGNSPPRSPVQTELALGTKVGSITNNKLTDDYAKDYLGCISSEPRIGKFGNDSDADAYKKLLKGLMEKAWWQPEAASALAAAITRFRLGECKRFSGGSRGDLWLLFAGPERVGKKKMASVLSEQICGTNPVVICLGKRKEKESDANFRGKTGMDRLAEAVRRNPFSVIMLEDIDEADLMVRGSIKQAIERGRLIDSYGREVTLGNAIIIVTGDWSSSYPESMIDGLFVDEKRVTKLASGSWQLGLIVRDRGTKRRTPWMLDEEQRNRKPRKETEIGVSLDLNLAASVCDVGDDKTDGSINASDLTMDQDDEGGVSKSSNFSITTVPHELAINMEELITFKPVESSCIRREIRSRLATKFSNTLGTKLSFEIGDDVVDKILGGLWHDQTSLEEWINNVVEPSFEELKPQVSSADERSSSMVVRLVVESDNCDVKNDNNTEWLPSSILV